MHRLNITIDVERLKNQPLLSEILEILKVIRPEWQIDRLQVKVCNRLFFLHIYFVQHFCTFYVGLHI